jgi:hypothetical protein
MSRPTLPLALASIALCTTSCTDRPDAAAAAQRALPTGARPEVVEMLREDLAAGVDPADGAGRAWLTHQEPEALIAGDTARFELSYEAGPLGVAAGGMVLLQVSPFWGWSTPQVEAPEGPGYTTVQTTASGVELTATTLDRQLLGIAIDGRALEAGERIDIVFGAGPAGARVDRFAERDTRLWVSVDGNGDGRRALVADSPTVDIQAGPPAQAVAHLPSAAEPGDEVSLRVAVLDRLGNGPTPVAAELALDLPPGLEGPATVAVDERGLARVTLRTLEDGVFRVRLRADGLFEAASNPMVVAPGLPRILWADLHGHSHFSDGTGIPEDYFRYARDVAALDVAALTDHDHWGMRPLSTHPAQWEEIGRQVSSFHEPGSFVTLLGYEWTNWIWGHRHVLYFEDKGAVFSSVDPQYETPEQLWAALRGKPALTFAHHSAGGPIATDWSIPPDPELEPVTEIVSVHGSSEASDSPLPIYSPVAGNFVRDALERGHRLGFIGSGDSHDGHPGLSHLASPSGGMAAVLADELTREAVLQAMRERRVYATNGPRIVLRTSLDGHRMGAEVPAAARHQLRGIVVAEAPLDRVDLVRAGGQVRSLPGDGRTFLGLDEEIPALAAGDWLYVRAVQIDGGAAWSSPFFAEQTP